MSIVYQDALNSLADGVCIIDQAYRVVFWNKRMEQWSQKQAADMQGACLLDIYPELNDIRYTMRIGQVLAGGPPAFFSMLLHHHMFPFRQADGALQPQRVTVSPLSQGEEKLALITVVDMTRSVLRESKYKAMLASYEQEMKHGQALARQNQMLVRAVDKAVEAFVMMRASGDIAYTNQAFLTQTGFKADEVLRLSYWDDVLPQDDEGLSLMVKQAVLSGEAWQGRMDIQRQDGTCFVASVSIAPMIDETGCVTHAVVIQEDISEQLKFEAQYRQTQKQEALTTLIGGIAHDFNNLLSGMMGHLYLAKQEVKAMPKTAVRLGKVQHIMNDIADIVQQLMTFARKGEVKKTKFPLGSFVKEFAKFVEHSIPDNIHFSIDFERVGLTCRGDVDSLQEALLNIVQNAVDAAVPERDSKIVLGLRAFDAEKTPEWVLKHPILAEGRFAHITVEDNGCGIPESHMDKVFDPFFTTKALGNGLGLAVAIGNIKNNHGMVDIESSQQGTTVHIWLPVLPEQKEARPLGDMPSKAGSQTILLVDDDALVRETCGEILSTLGYRVLHAEDGQYALELMQDKGDTVDLIVMDMVMPRMTGTTAASHIRALYPDIPIVFATAYDQSISIKACKDFTHSVLISKPFHPDVLQEHIEAFLAE